MRFSSLRVPGLASVRADVIHDVLEGRHSDVGMIAQPREKLPMGVGGDVEIVATYAMELQDSEPMGVTHAFGVGNRRGSGPLVSTQR
jgi:hypothetical protein